ncbi:MAG: aspartate kinase [Chlamydiae bacterium]|nr:aspartate kinase [Chlamydiota bacterium]
MRPRIVLKFGGKSLSSVEEIHNIKDIIICYIKQGYQVITVVSAMGNTTDNLLNLAHSVVPNPQKRELDLLVSVGERISMTLLTMALIDANIGAVSFTGSQSGILTTKDFTDAKILEVRPTRIEEALKRGLTVVVAGFQGVSFDKEVTTLGRGGSDTTAVALCHALLAEKVAYFKDVGSLFSENPHKNSQAVKIKKIDYQGAVELLNGEVRPLLHLRALSLARRLSVPLEIVSSEKKGGFFEVGTVICGDSPIKVGVPTTELAT